MRGRIWGLEKQLIGEVSRLGLGQPDTIALWYGESDQPTPAFICDAAYKAMRAGETFYTHKRGLPELRQTLATYMAGLYGVPMDMERITITMSGMAAIMLSFQALLDAGDNCAIVAPVWPNCSQGTEVMGAEPRRVALELENGVWRLDTQRLMDACDERTRAIFVNSPGNPTGWMLAADQQREILDFCRRRGIWLVADEVYARLVYDRPVAPSFLQVAEPDDPLLVVNSFSKSWAMTGWRIGWLTHPVWMGETISSLIEFSTAAVSVFTQRAGIAAVSEGEPFVAAMLARCRAGRDTVVPRLQAMPRVAINPPSAAFYAFFKVDGVDDSLAFAQEIFHKTNVGLAPGSAFGPEGEGSLRLCFASSPERLNRAMDLLEPMLR
ncbi:MAG: aminotransferase class I/II-fold pyridoxal phosphate-dependent enzyme [Alphaproteobacteria bacterium]|nr:aminotransferase class I/II-fold pyridoxal phosphate-dependent enzyme [Alphaproteobacteria bacterium]